ncbi:hypothetical protein FRC08_014954 [Ceratobasidium sp. 394]|nr:hypothetical protein FRC08_014954 [Ceratobasidium sp. 394]
MKTSRKYARFIYAHFLQFATSPTQHPSLTPVFLASPRHSQSKSRRARLHAAILMSGTQDKFAPKVLCRIAKSHHPAVVAAVKVVARIATGFISADDN